MARTSRKTAIGIAVLFIGGAALSIAGVLSITIGTGTKPNRNYLGQPDMAAFTLPIGLLFIALALIFLFFDLRLRIQVWFAERRARRAGAPSPEPREDRLN